MVKKIVSYAVGLYSVTVFASVMRIVTKSLIAKTVGKEALGAYAFYATAMTLGSSLLAFGLKRAITKHVAASQEEGRFAPVVTAIMALLVVASLVLAGVGLLLNRWVEWVYVLILFSVGPFTLFEVARSTLRGQLDRKREMALVLASVAVQMFCVLMLVLLTHQIHAPVWGLTIAHVLVAVALVLYFSRRYRTHWQLIRLGQVCRSPELIHLLRLGAPLWITDILEIVGHQTDQFIVQGRLGYAALAEYAAAFTFIGLLDQPITVLSSTFLATFSGGLYSDLEQYKVVSSWNMAFFTVFGLLTAAVSVPLTPLVFTEAYTLVPLLVAVLSIAFVFCSIEVLNSALTIAQDYSQANRNAKICTTVLYIPLAYLLVSRFGVLGAAWSYVISWGGYALTHAAYMRRRLPMHAAHTFRTILIGTALYGCAAWGMYLVHTGWVVVGVIPVYLGLGHLLRLWDLRQAPELVHRLLPQRLAKSVGLPR